MLILMTATSVQAQTSDARWRVFTERAPAHSAPRTDSSTPGNFQRGVTITGEYYVDPQTDEEWLKVPLGGNPVFVPRWHIHRVHPNNEVEGNIPIGTEVVDRWWGLPLDYEPDDLEPLPRQYRFQMDREFPLRREVRAALIEMLEAAKAEGLDIRVCSAYRPASYQIQLYTNAISRSGANQRYSAPPGHSEHQLGTCVDLTDAAGEHVLKQSFGDTPHGQWLERNAHRFGFKRSYYPENVDETGYISEPWHWRYWGVESNGEQGGKAEAS